MAMRIALLLAAFAGCTQSQDSSPNDGAMPPPDSSAHMDAGTTSAEDGGDGGAQGSDASGSRRHVYSGTLDSSGNATLSVPEISLASMPLTIGYVYSSAYAEPGFVMLGNIIPGDGMFRFAAGATNANAQYHLVVLDADHVETGLLDADGNASLSVAAISVANMPLVLGYVFSTAYAEPGYVALGNIIPGDGTFRFAAGSGNANAPFILVIASSDGHAAGTLDSGGNATQAVSAIDLADMPAVLGYVSTSAYAEPGYVPLGGIVPSDDTFRFAAGAGNAAAPFVVSWAR